MAAHHARKPLPALPNPSPNPTLQSTLSLDARDHRGRLIRYFLADAIVSEHEHERDHDVGGRRDLEGWAWVVEEALDGMGYALGREGWLGRVRRGEEIALKVSDRSRQEEKGKGKEKERKKTERFAAEQAAPRRTRVASETPAHPRCASCQRRKGGHLVLCIAPHGSPTALPTEDSGFDIVPANIACVFTPGSFVLQSEVFCLGWMMHSLATDLRLVGGTFTFKGVTSPAQHVVLTKILRLAIYIHLSLVLEQHFLADSGVELKIKAKVLPPPSRPSAPLQLQAPPKSEEDLKTPTRPTRRTSIIPSSVTHFFAKRSFGPRAQTIQSPIPTRARGSLDLGITPSVPLAAHSASATSMPAPVPVRVDGPLSLSLAPSSFPSQMQAQRIADPSASASPPSRKSFDGLRMNRFSRSFIGMGGSGVLERDYRSANVLRPPRFSWSSLSSRPSSSIAPTATYTWIWIWRSSNAAVHDRTDEDRGGEGGVELLVDLARKEGLQQQQQLYTRKRLRGDERVALGSLLGWEFGRGDKDRELGRDPRTRGQRQRQRAGSGMWGILGFARQQEISVLVSTHVPRVQNGGKGGKQKEQIGGKQKEVRKENENEKAKEDSSSSSSSSSLDSNSNSNANVSVNSTNNSNVNASLSSGSSSGSKSGSAAVSSTISKSKEEQEQGEGSSAFNAAATSSTSANSAVTATTAIAPTTAIPMTITASTSSSDPNTTTATTTTSSFSSLSSSSSSSPTISPSSHLPTPSNLPASGLSPFLSSPFLRWFWSGSGGKSGDHDRDHDTRLGEWVTAYIKKSKDACEVPGCAFEVGRHEVRVIHDGVRIVLRVGEGDEGVEGVKGLRGSGGEGEQKEEEEEGNEKEEEEEEEEEAIWMWSSCAVCAKTSKRVKMSDGTYAQLGPSSNSNKFKCFNYFHSKSSCAASQSQSRAVSFGATHVKLKLTTLAVNIIRHFSLSRPNQIQNQLNFRCRGCRLVVLALGWAGGGSGGAKSAAVLSTSPPPPPPLMPPPSAERRGNGVENKEGTKEGGDGDGEEAKKEGEGDGKKTLRREIRKWWEGVADHVDKINQLGIFDSSKGFAEIPSTDEAYDMFDRDHDVEALASSSGSRSGRNTPRPEPLTPTALHPPRLPPTPMSPFKEGRGQVSYSSGTSDDMQVETPSVPPKDVKEDDKDKTPMPVPSPPAPLPLPAPALPTPAPTPAQQLLTHLRHNFHKIEQSLYTQLARTSPKSLNDVRITFLATARGTQKRLQAWKKKHLSKDQARAVGEMGVSGDSGGGSGEGWVPEWWKGGCHAVPGTDEYHLELASLSAIRPTTTTTTHTPLSRPATPRAVPDPTTGPSTSSFFSVATGYKLFSTSSSGKNQQPDPDQEDVVWNEPEPYSAVISRKEQHVRDPTSLLSIRDVLRHRTVQEVVVGGQSASASASVNVNVNANAGQASTTPLVSGLEGGVQTVTVKAKPDVGLNIEAAEVVIREERECRKVVVARVEGWGECVCDDGARYSCSFCSYRTCACTGGGVEAVFCRSASNVTNTVTWSTLTSSGGTQTEAAGGVDGPGSNLVSKKDFAGVLTSDNDAASQASQSTIGKDKGKVKKDNGKATEKQGDATVPSTPTTTSTMRQEGRCACTRTRTQHDPSSPLPTSSGFASALASGLNSAMRYVLNQDHHPNSRPSSSVLASGAASRSMSPPTKTKHPMFAGDMSISTSAIDERPHVKYDWTIGKRLKFSCTVYYAKQFDTLRKRCGISNDAFVKSLARSANWAAVGGKSKSNFWKTGDERFIIKTLVNAWNVADLQVLNDLAPSYFRYMDSTASRATVLAKLVGFYTIEIRNLETGNVQSKADLLVMENLFYGQKISKTFDLKGIQGRKVKSRGDTTKTLFDGEWIEGQQRTLTLVRPHSKVVLREAIKNDAEFLSRSNIMDYSLLLGVDEGKKEIVCGLVDTIGSYTIAKTLEYKAKQGLQSGKEVTVMPPTEYQERFINALEGYFVACPDKWSKPLDESKIINDPNLLPGVL
ncbi:hypothetical protein CPB84DRAFT_1747322 [Gymnopilus junonius]|uniref:PIPK domain-containing protein n=1 Tax=Gymnopilus junonius TaxID=109634 RepID=A0A9P5TN61_GYMJU|nr:hypothetical protein CPB84DRAFT_1747322 [Gymnopilus junonius]